MIYVDIDSFGKDNDKHHMIKIYKSSISIRFFENCIQTLHDNDCIFRAVKDNLIIVTDNTGLYHIEMEHGAEFKLNGG